jgi:hypothetical protein
MKTDRLLAALGHFGFVTHNRRPAGIGQLKSSGRGLSAWRTSRIEALEQRTLLSLSAPGGLEAGYLPPRHDLFQAGGYLTEPSSRAPLEIAMGYLDSHPDSLGLLPADVLHSVVTDQYTDSDTGLTHIYLRQEFNGLEVVNANMNVNVTADGRVLNVGAALFGGYPRWRTSLRRFPLRYSRRRRRCGRASNRSA